MADSSWGVDTCCYAMLEYTTRLPMVPFQQYRFTTLASRLCSKRWPNPGMGHTKDVPPFRHARCVFWERTGTLEVCSAAEGSRRRQGAYLEERLGRTFPIRCVDRR